MKRLERRIQPARVPPAVPSDAVSHAPTPAPRLDAEQVPVSARPSLPLPAIAQPANGWLPVQALRQRQLPTGPCIWVPQPEREGTEPVTPRAPQARLGRMAEAALPPLPGDWIALLAKSSAFTPGCIKMALVGAAAVYVKRLEESPGTRHLGLNPSDIFIVSLRLASKMETRCHAGSAFWLNALHGVRMATACYRYGSNLEAPVPSLRDLNETEAAVVHSLNWHLTVSREECIAALRALLAQPATPARSRLADSANTFGLGETLRVLVNAGVN